MDIPAIIESLGTDKEASEKLGISASAVNRLRHGVSKPSHETMLKLLAILEERSRRKPRFRAVAVSAR